LPAEKNAEQKKSNKMEYLEQYDHLNPYLENADVTDVKMFEGYVSLREFISAMLSYYPWWIVWLYRIRELVVHVLGLVRHEKPDGLPELKPEDLSFTPGDPATFFIVQEGKEEQFWVAKTPEDNHLTAYFCVVKESIAQSRFRYHVITSVFYEHWTGRVYFNLIRPFHHLVVSRMAQYGLKRDNKAL